MRGFIFFLGLTWAFSAQGQSIVSAGLLPEVNVSYRWLGKWRITGQVESMQQVWRKNEFSELQGDYKYIRTDFTSVISYKLNPDLTLAGGYLLRFSEGETIHRSIQQISSVYKKIGVRIGHRLRTDQTFEPKESFEFRLRYRFSAELPLNGLSINDREWYLIASTEFIGSVQKRDWDYEHRVVGSLGYNFNASNKIETGLDYRLNRFLNDAPRHRVWWTISYFLNL
jgi:hypothetical protein